MRTFQLLDEKNGSIDLKLCENIIEFEFAFDEMINVRVKLGAPIYQEPIRLFAPFNVVKIVYFNSSPNQ